MPEEIRTVYKSGIVAGFTPSLSGQRGHRLWSEGQNKVHIEGFNYWQKPDFDARHAVRGRHVWYSMTPPRLKETARTTVLDLIEQARPSGTFDYIAQMLPGGHSGPVPKALTDLVKQNPLSAQYPSVSPQVRLLKSLHNEFKVQSAAYTGNYLSEINTVLADTYGDDVRESPKRAGGRPLSIREQAHGSRWTSEEQTDILTDQATQAENADDLVAPPIGDTQAVDVYLHVGDRIIAIDTSEQLASEGGHHSLTGGRIPYTADELVNSRDTIRRRMVSYYNTEIQQKWNPAVRLIKQVAQDTYGTDTVTAEQMRAPSGTGYGGGTVHRTGPGTWAPGGGQSMTLRQVHGRSKGRSAAWAAARQASQFSDDAITEATTKHVMHAIGTWNAHGGSFWDTYTLSHTPLHITAGAKLVQYMSGNKMFEWRRLKMASVAVWDGPATHGVLQHEGAALNKRSSQILDDQMAGHLGNRALGRGIGTVMVGGITTRAATSGGRLGRGVSMGIFIPGKSLNAKMNRICRELVDARGEQRVQAIHGAMQVTDGPNSFSSNTSMQTPGSFTQHLNQFKLQRGQQLGAAERTSRGGPRQGPADAAYQMWANPYYGIQDVGNRPESS